MAIDVSDVRTAGSPSRTGGSAETRADALALGTAVDCWLDRVLHRRLSRPVSALAVAWGVTPNLVTLTSLVVGALAAASLWQATAAGAVAGLVLYLGAVVIDHADGEVARLTGTQSTLGHWLDIGVDTAVHAMVVLAMGSVAAGTGPPGARLLGPVAAAGVVASAAAAHLRPPRGPAWLAADRVLDALGNRHGFYAMLLAFAVLVAGAPQWLPWLMLIVMCGAHGYWLGAVLLLIRRDRGRVMGVVPILPFLAATLAII
jgi:hypothetical protein